MKKIKNFIVNSGIGFAVETFIAPMKNILGQLASVAHEAGNDFGGALGQLASVAHEAGNDFGETLGAAIDFVIDNFFNFKK